MVAPIVVGTGAVLAGLLGLILLFHVTKVSETLMFMVMVMVIAYLYYG